jgi:transposase-like protein
MAYGKPICACCGAVNGVARHHLYPKTDGCPDDLTVWLCHSCRQRAYGMRAGIAKADAAGVYKSRSASVDPGRVRQLKAQGFGPSHIARKLGISRASVYRALEG